MIESDLLILGAGGKTGSRLAALFNTGDQAVWRASRKPKAADERAFDWAKPDEAIMAFKGVKRAYIVAPTDRSDHAAVMLPVLRAALDQGVERMVLLSSSSLQRGGPMMGQIHDWMAETVPEWVVLRPSWFMQNFAEGRHFSSLQQDGRIYSATGEARLGFIDALDIARVAHSALTGERAWNTDVVLTGPQLLSYSDIAAIMSETLGRSVAHICLSSEALAARLMQAGLGADYARTLAEMDVALSTRSEELTDEVFRRTGWQPRTFADFLTSDPVFCA